MCFIDSTEDTGDAHECPMCKVFNSNRCRHISDTCRNKENHPMLGVVHLVNAEVPIFNGCGYCKWARANPNEPPNLNQGWPGCCRPPDPQECNTVQASDWPAVSVIHQVPMPAHIKAILDSATTGKITQHSPTSSKPVATLPIPNRRSDTSASVSPSITKSSPPSTKSSPTAQSNKALPGTATSAKSGYAKKRSGSGSPRSSALNPSSLPNASHLDGQKRLGSSDAIDKLRVSPPRRSSDLPPRKFSELETPKSRRGSGAHAPNIAGGSPVATTSPSSTIRRRSSISSSPPIGSSGTRASDRPYATVSARVNGQRTSIDAALNGKSHHSNGGALSAKSGGSGSEASVMTDSTVTSDGGFTDYLSDESDAELQRQAEARAVLAAQNQAEEAEFKAARQQLAHVGLRPPKAWDTGRLVPAVLTPAGGVGQRA